MATDFTNNNKTISASGGLQPTTINTPLDVRTRVNLKADIDSIPNPFVGMKILVLQDETNNNEMTEYVVVSLKADSLGIENSKVNEVVLTKDFLGVSGNGTTGTNMTSIVLGNYQIKYNSTDDTLDFLYNGVIDEPDTTDTYVTEGLSMYIDATRGSISDITGNYTITNNGVSTTSDNNYLNFVASESDYIDTNLVPNLSTWSAEIYFYYTAELGADTQVILGWGVSGSKFRIGYSDSTGTLVAQSNNETNYTISNVSDLLSPHHLIVTMNNGALTSYLDGVKTVLCTSGGIQTSHTGTLKIGCKYNGTEQFANINLRMFRFYDGKVLSDEEALRNYNYELKNSYVTEGLSMYIDTSDVTTYGSIRDITGNYTITNNGVSTTSDNNYLNFVASESDYIDTNLVPNLSTWSAEIYFHYTSMPTSTEVVVGWGKAGDNNIRIAYSASSDILAVQSNGGTNYKLLDGSEILSLHHIIITMNNGSITSYVDGIKTVLCTDATVQSSHDGTLKIGSRYSGTKEFANMHLKLFRFYDGKVLTDEEALQNYNYEINRDSNILSVAWIYNKKPDSDTGELVATENNACTEFISYDSSYNYTLTIDTVAFFRVFYYDSSQSYISNDSIDNNFNGVITPPENTEYMRLKLSRKTVEFADLDNHVILRKTLK